MELAKVKVSANQITIEKKHIIVAGTIGATVTVEYDDLWNSMDTKTLVWRSGSVTKDDITASGIVPAEVLEKPGRELFVGVYGTKCDTATPTLWARLGYIHDGADPSGDETTDPSLPVWAQLQTRIDDMEGEGLAEAVNDALVKAKENGEFDGEDGVSATHSWDGTVLTVTSASGTTSADLKGEKGDTGPQGPAGEQGPKGDPAENSGDMYASVYDPQGKKRDIFKYADEKTAQQTFTIPANSTALFRTSGIYACDVMVRSNSGGARGVFSVTGYGMSPIRNHIAALQLGNVVNVGIAENRIGFVIRNTSSSDLNVYVVYYADNTLTQSAYSESDGAISWTESLENQINARLPLAGGVMAGPLTLNADPTGALHATTKQYVDNAIAAAVASLTVATEVT